MISLSCTIRKQEFEQYIFRIFLVVPLCPAQQTYFTFSSQPQIQRLDILGIIIICTILVIIGMIYVTSMILVKSIILVIGMILFIGMILIISRTSVIGLILGNTINLGHWYDPDPLKYIGHWYDLVHHYDLIKNVDLVRIMLVTIVKIVDHMATNIDKYCLAIVSKMLLLLG